MNFATFAIVVFALVVLILIVVRWGPSSSAVGKELSPPVGPPCPNCGQPRGQVDRYCRRCGEQLSSSPASSQTPPAQQ